MTNPPTSGRVNASRSPYEQLSGKTLADTGHPPLPRAAVPAWRVDSESAPDIDPVHAERTATIRALTQIMADLLLTTDPAGILLEHERLRLVRRLTGGLAPYRELLAAATPSLTEPVSRGEYGALLRQLPSRPSAAVPGRVPPPRRVPLTASRIEARRNGLL